MAQVFKDFKFRSTEALVAEYYAAQGKQKLIDGLGTVEEIAARIRQAIG